MFAHTADVEELRMQKMQQQRVALSACYALLSVGLSGVPLENWCLRHDLGFHGLDLHQVIWPNCWGCWELVGLAPWIHQKLIVVMDELIDELNCLLVYLVLDWQHCNSCWIHFVLACCSLSVILSGSLVPSAISQLAFASALALREQTSALSLVGWTYHYVHGKLLLGRCLELAQRQASWLRVQHQDQSWHPNQLDFTVSVPLS